MAGRQIDQLFYTITARTGGFTKGLGTAARSMKGFLGKLTPLTAGLALFGAAAVAAGIKATRMAAALDSALREVSTLLPGTVENIRDLRKEVIQLSTEVPEPPELLSKGLYQVISAGITDTAEAMGVLRVAARAAVAGLTDTFTSVDAITTILNAYGLASSEAARVSDVLFATVKAGKTTFGELSANIGTVATSAALAGVSIEEASAALATMTKFGINTARSATALDALLRSITSATDEQRESARKLGVEYTTTNLRAKGLVGFLQELKEATGGSVDALAKITTQAEAQRASFILAGAGAEEYGRILVQTTESQGASSDAFAKMSESLENQAALLKNKVNAVWLELGSNILPTVLDALEAINRLLESDAQTLARAFEKLGLSQEAAAILVAESRKKLAKDLSETAGEIRRSIEGIITTGEGLRPTRFGGSTALGRIPESDFDKVFPTEELISALDRGAVAQREIVEATIEHGRELLANGELEGAAVKQLADQLNNRQALVTTLDQQIAGEERLLDLLDSRQREDPDKTQDPEAEPTVKLTEAERKALDLRDALLQADAVLRSMGESGADLFSEVPAIIADVQARIKDVVDSLDADFGRFSLESRLLQAQRAIRGVARSGASFGEQALAIQGILSAWNIEVDQLPPGFQAVVRGLVEVEGEIGEAESTMLELVQDISFAARGAVELAAAFGLVDDEAAAVLNQMALIGEGIARIASGDILAGIGGVASGLAGIISGLFGGGPSEEEIARDESLEANTRRLQELSERMDILASVLRGLPGDLQSGLTDALGPIADEIREALDAGGGFFSQRKAQPEARSDIVQLLADAGLSVVDLREAAQLLGVDVDQLLRLIEGGDLLETSELQEALQQAQSLFEALDVGLSDLLDTTRGRLDLLRASFDILDIDDASDQIRLLADELERVRRESRDFALTAEEIARLGAGDESLIEQIFREIQSGSGRFTELGAFGELSFDQFLDLLREIEGLQDRLSAGGEEGDFQSVSAINRATVEQGDTLIAMAGSRNFFLEQIRDSLRDGIQPVQVTAQMMDAAGSIQHHHAGEFVVRVEGDASGISPEAATALGESMAGTLDRDMAARLRNVRAGLGLPPKRTQ